MSIMNIVWVWQLVGMASVSSDTSTPTVPCSFSERNFHVALNAVTSSRLETGPIPALCEGDTKPGHSCLRQNMIQAIVKFTKSFHVPCSSTFGNTCVCRFGSKNSGYKTGNDCTWLKRLSIVQSPNVILDKWLKPSLLLAIMPLLVWK